MSNYTRWYREGTVSATTGSNVITGTGTYWKTAGLNTGDILKLGGNDYEILSVTDDTHLTIAGTFGGVTASGMAYAVVRNFTSTMQSKVAANVAGLLEDYAKYLNTSMATVYGKSAYEIACAKGYVGTESQWLESLIGAGKWDVVDARTSFLDTVNKTELHKMFYRGRNLGSEITEAQYAAISSGTFDNLWVGDYWYLDIPGFTQKTFARIADINYFNGRWECYDDAACTAGGYTWAGLGRNHLVLMLGGQDVSKGVGLNSTDYSIGDSAGTVYQVKMNATDSTEGGFAGSTMYTEVLPKINAKLTSYFGDHLRTHVASISNAVTDGQVTGYVKDLAAKAMLPNISQLQGDFTNRATTLHAGDNHQFALYKYLSSWGIYTCGWTRDVASATSYYYLLYCTPNNTQKAASFGMHSNTAQLVPYIIIA